MFFLRERQIIFRDCFRYADGVRNVGLFDLYIFPEENEELLKISSKSPGI